MCKFCDENDPRCCKERSSDGYLCTRLPGHKGPHVACGCRGDHMIVMWDETGIRGRDGKWYPKRKKGVPNANSQP